ncbi:hypothetical protein HY990_07275 [Candidatus Micrarchaeota archaeon]|nr:hypothetical protein [Candidatus Micrarchaeota archaeon]
MLARAVPRQTGPLSVTTGQIVSAIETGRPAQIVELWRSRSDPTMTPAIRMAALTQVHGWLLGTSSGRMGELFRGDFATASGRAPSASVSDQDKMRDLYCFCNWLAGRPYLQSQIPARPGSATAPTTSPIAANFADDLSLITGARDAGHPVPPGSPNFRTLGGFRSPYFSHVFDMPRETREPNLELVIALAVARRELAHSTAPRDSVDAYRAATVVSVTIPHDLNAAITAPVRQ